MKKALTILLVSLLGIFYATAQSTLNNSADNIVGEYEGVQNGYKFRAKIEKMTDGSYRGQVIWMEHDRDKNGNKLLDTKNPDRSLRSTPADRIELFRGLRYDKKRQEWDGCKIYDPLRGIRAKLVVRFTDKGTLRLKGSLLGISESVYWNKLK